MTTCYDFLVIGGGSGGIASARRAAQHGAKVGLIEAGRLGGTCVNVGCVPKKLMWHAAQIAEALEDAADYGFDLTGWSHGWPRLVERREAYLRRLNGIYADNLDGDEVDVIRGRAAFVDAHTLEVDGRRLEAERLLIATGGHAQWPDVPGADLGLDSDGFFALTERPERVVLVGSGYIAVELAGVLAALGSEVHLVIRRDRVLRGFDPLLSEVLMEEMANSGLTLHRHREVQRVDGRAGDLSVTLSEGEAIAADALIWAIGRAPNTAALNLPAAGLELAASGHVPVDEWQATAQPHIFAVGDVTPAPALTPVAIAAGRRLADRLFGGQSERRLADNLVPTVIFSHPPIGTIGLSEAEAREKFGDAEVHTYVGRFRSLYYGVVDHKVASAVKMIVTGADERIVGLHCIGPGTDEMLQGFAVALNMGARKRDFDDTIAIHPTAAEEVVTLK